MYLKQIFNIILFSLFSTLFCNGQVVHPKQPISGPGGGDYLHQSYKNFDQSKKANGFWIYEPADPKPDSANVVVFIHGFGVSNPVVYGAWIKHLVQRGNIVISPRYQKAMFATLPSKYAQNSTEGIQSALKVLQEEGHVKPRMENIIIAGHSYGAAIAGYLGVLYKEYDLPKPKGILMAQPGTGNLRGARLDSYEALEKDIKLIITVGHGDHVVGDKLARTVMSTAKVDYQNLVLHVKDIYGAPIVHSSHAQPCALDQDLDNGRTNYIVKAAQKRADTDAVDYFGYWKLLDALIDCSFYNINCHYAFGNTKEQKYLGTWSDGTPIKPMVIFETLDN